MRLRTSLLVVVLLLISLVVPVAEARADGTCQKVDRVTNQCTVTGGGGSQVGGDSSNGVKVPPARCLADGIDVPCKGEFGEWHNVYQCYVKMLDSGNASCHALNGDETIILADNFQPPPPDPRVMAWQILAQIDIRAGEIGLAPTTGNALVGMPTWMWVDNPGPTTTGPVTRSTTAQGYTVTIEARLARVVYIMGDGTTVTCSGVDAAGTRYLDRYGMESSPTCGHRYLRPGSFPVTATSQWEVAWYGIGEAGVIALEVQRSAEVTVREGHAVVR